MNKRNRDAGQLQEGHHSRTGKRQRTARMSAVSVHRSKPLKLPPPHVLKLPIPSSPHEAKQQQSLAASATTFLNSNSTAIAARVLFELLNQSFEQVDVQVIKPNVTVSCKEVLIASNGELTLNLELSQAIDSVTMIKIKQFGYKYVNSSTRNKNPLQSSIQCKATITGLQVTVQQNQQIQVSFEGTIVPCMYVEEPKQENKNDSPKYCANSPYVSSPAIKHGNSRR